MSYQHIENLYRNQTILMFRECWATEKVHGTSAHVAWKDSAMHFFAGGAKHEQFSSLFDAKVLTAAFTALGYATVVVYGEAYGGKIQAMRHVYGPDLRFIAFEVRVGETWLSVSDMAVVATTLGFEAVPFVRIPATLEAIDGERDAPSEVARRRGMGEHPREGVVLRPIYEMCTSKGRVIAKHKRDEFRERTTPQKIVDPAALVVLSAAKAIAEEWVTPMRLAHVLDALGGEQEIERTGEVIKAMVADVQREAAGEIVESIEARRAIGKRAAKLYQVYLAGRSCL